MGAINCCVDISAIDASALSTRPSAATLSSAISIGLAADTPTNQLHDKRQPDPPKEERPRTPSHTSSPTPPRASESVADDGLQLKHKKTTRRTRANRARRYASAQRDIWVNDYLCPCDGCPNAKSADRIVDLLFETLSGNTDTDPDPTLRSTLHRILRACATFDERHELDLALAQQAYAFLAPNTSDEDAVFRKIVAVMGHSVRPAHQIDAAAALKRRSSAVTA